MLDAGVGKAYNWLPGNSAESKLPVTTFGRYIVKVISEEGCESTDTINIVQECDPQLWIPNVFTPFDDNAVNNTFKPVAHDVAQFEMRIYNRWGELLFITNDINKGWDGTFQSQQCPLDAYLWTIYYTGYHTTKYLYGAVTLLR